MSPPLKHVLDFLTYCVDTLKLGYSAINTVRSALSAFITIENIPIGTHPVVIRFVKGIFQTKPVIPKNTTTWDVAVVFDYLKRLSPVAKLSLKDLTMKAVTLTAILSGQRAQSLYLSDIRNITLSRSLVTITFGDLLKQTRPGYQLESIKIKAYAPDRRLCLITVLTEYLERTRPLRGVDTKLFITTVKPYHGASRQTISSWVKKTLQTAGVDMTTFTPHSTRSAATSAAKSSNIPLETILKAAGWSNVKTFATYYQKPIQQVGQFANSLLEKGGGAASDTSGLSD